MVEWDGELHEVDRKLYDEAVEYLRESIPKQAEMPDGDSVEYFGRMYYKSGKKVDGIKGEGVSNRLCYGSAKACASTMKKIKRNKGKYKNKKNKSKTYPFSMNVHLHPGTDSNSMLFSVPDTSLSIGENIPVFIGNMNGDVSVFLPVMGNDTLQGRKLCEGCAK